MALPPNFDHGNRPLARSVAWALAQRASGKANTSEQAAFAVDEREAREAMALSCGMITMIDDAIGRVLATLQARGLAEDTIVIFTTDHGDFLGDHRLMLKGPAHFEAITHVPFIWAEPGRGPARTADTLAGTLDIAATVLDRAQIQPYNGIQGESLLPAIGGGALANPRDAMVIEDDQQRASLGFETAPRLRTLVTEALAADDRAQRPVGRALRPGERPARDGQPVRRSGPSRRAGRTDGAARLSRDGAGRPQSAADGPRLTTFACPLAIAEPACAEWLLDQRCMR